MKKICLLLLILLLAGMAQAADDPLMKGMKLYKKHRYQDAARKLYPLMDSASSERRQQIDLSLGLVCYASARLYRELYDFSLHASRDYLQRLLADENQSQSRLAGLYLGKTLLLTGYLDESAALFDKFLAQESGNSPDVQMARIDRGLVYYRQGRPEKASKIWANLKPEDPVTLTAMAAAYSDAQTDAARPTLMCRDALVRLETEGRQPPIQVLNNTLAVYTREGLIDQCRTLLQNADLKACFQEEALMENKIIRFYDPALLLNLARFYGSAAEAHFKAAAEASVDKKRDWANAWLLEARMLFDSPESNKTRVDTLLMSKSLPEKVKTRLKIRQAVLHHTLGDKQSARQQLQALINQKSDPEFIADLLLTCDTHGIDFPEAVIKAATLAQKSNGRRMTRLYLALGNHYLRKSDAAKALTYLEIGRDKSNKNRIEYNDPLLLVALARSYYNQRHYSESLEIFFEMSKQFQAVRQLQASIQGVYSIEQKSAGDAKLF